MGVFSPWGFGMAFVVLVPNLIDGSGIFVRFGASFQSWPAMPFVLVGSVMVGLGLYVRGEAARRIAIVSVAVVAIVFGKIAYIALPDVPRDRLSVGAATAGELARVETRIPPNAEVISSEAVIGRFAQRDAVYAFLGVGQTFPVSRPLVVIVLTPKVGLDDGLTHGRTPSAVAFAHDVLHAHVLGTRSGVDAFAWSPPPGTTRVILP